MSYISGRQVPVNRVSSRTFLLKTIAPNDDLPFIQTVIVSSSATLLIKNSSGTTLKTINSGQWFPAGFEL